MKEELFTITKKSAFAFTGRLTGVVFAFVFNLIAARYMGADNYGKVMYIFNILLFFSMFSQMGLKGGLIHLMPALKLEGKKEQLKGMVSFSIILSFVLSIIMVVILYFSRNFLADILGKSWIADMFYYMAPLIPMLVFLELSQGIFRGVEIVRYFIMGEFILLPVLKVLTVIIVAVLGYRLSGLIFTYYISYAMVSIYLIVRLIEHKLPGKIKLKENNLYLRLTKFSFPLMLSSMLSFFIGRLDIFMIGYYLSAGEVGIYNIALRIGTLSSIVMISFRTIFAPVISSLYHQQDIDSMTVLYKTVTKWITGINLIALSMIFIFSEDIMRVFGGEFTIGALALILIGISELFNALAGPAGTMIVMTGHSTAVFYISIQALLLNGVLNIFLIPRYGMEGAALTTLITLVFINIIRLIILYREYRLLPFSRGTFKVITAAVLSAVMVKYFSVFLGMHYIVNMIVSLLVYIIIFTVLNLLLGISAEDRLVLDKIKDKFIKGD